MTQFPVSTSNEQSIYAALELSKNSWLLAIQVPGRDNPSLYPIGGGNAEGLEPTHFHHPGLPSLSDRNPTVPAPTPAFQHSGFPYRIPHHIVSPPHLLTLVVRTMWR